MTYLTTAQVAKHTRDDIKTARTNGTLGDNLPTDLRISVTSRNHLSITVKTDDTAWSWTGDKYSNGRPSEAARTLGRRLVEIARPHHAKGYDFGFVYLDEGVSLGSLGRPGWTPGQD